MASVSPSFILGVLLLLYLVSFVLFAIIRNATGISIQRIGYFSLRRIAYASTDGVRIDLRGLGLHLHRPTFAQPTWISLQLTELKVTLDLKALSGGADAQSRQDARSLSVPIDGPYCRIDSSTRPLEPLPRPGFSRSPRSQTWKRLTLLKERIKRLHEKIHWLRIVDVVALNSSFVITDVGSVEMGTATMAVDTRRKTVDRGRLFRHKKAPEGDQRPAEWLFVIKSVLFTPEGKDALEIVDNCSLNIHGLLYKGLEGLRDASVSLKLGRVHIPYDDVLLCRKRIEHCRRVYGSQDIKEQDQEISMIDVMEELDRPGSREENLVQTVSDSKEFISSILRGIQEIQLGVSFIGMSKEVHSIQPSDSPLYVSVAMNEVGIDLHRLDPKSPAHRMYFSSKDIAHQALLAAISIAVSVEDSAGTPERLLYIPMATTTVKTTLPSKTVAFSEDKDAAERNANILFANLVVTSPSIDLDPKHMPLVMALMRSRMKPSHPPADDTHRQRLISRLLPKANIKFSVHEPVVRVTLPPSDPSLKNSGEYDILISSISSIALDVESSHASAGDLHYSLVSNLRVSSHLLYYQTASGERHNLLSNDALELKLQVDASPEVCVVATGNLQTFSVHLVRPEITAGVRQITHQLRSDIQPTFSTIQTTSSDPTFLRRLPPWLIGFQFQGSDFGVEVAGVDPDLSENTRGVALQLESWNAEYKIQKLATVERHTSRRRATSHLAASDEPEFKITPPSPSNRKSGLPTDGRRLAIHVRGFQGFIVEGFDTWESDSFLSLPRFEVAFTTSSDTRGPVFHVNSYVKAMYLHYSLYRYYAIGVAATVLKKAFTGSKTVNLDSPGGQEDEGKYAANTAPATNQSQSASGLDLVTVDIKAGLLQVKAKMPADPPLLLSVFGLEAGRHRWAAPFMNSHLVRLCAKAPQVKSAWARLASIKDCRIDLRESRRKHGKTCIDETSIDISADFIRLSVPHQLVIHNVFENLTNVMKATEQLHHRFKTGTSEHVLKKRPEEPNKVPRISIRCKSLLFCLDDGPFDWKLGTIYRIGLVEQKQRLAREDAYRAKVKKLQESQHHRHSSRRAQSAHANPGRGKRSQNQETKRRSSSTEGRPYRPFSSRSGVRGRRMRYDPEGACTMTETAHISIDQAWRKLQEHNAQSWRKRIDMAMKSQNLAIREIRSIFWGGGEVPDNADETETILAIPDRPALMSTLISDLHVLVDKPSFPLQEYPLYLNRVGKGMPYNMEYSLLIPMSLQIDMGEARVSLRDYPLPLLHVPAIRPGQSPRLPSWSLKTDFVIAEEYRGPESIRHARVEIVPAEIMTNPTVSGGFAIDVRRTVSPVKTYSDVDIAINTSAPTSITWGTSYQPAIQDMMMIIEGFTKPQVDPSDRTGFWDKIRLSAHSRVKVAWKGDGDVHLKLKGSRDPYVVTGHGTGFVMCWRNNIRWQIHADDDPRKFMTVTSGEYVLAIPDYSHQARQTSDMSSSDSESLSIASSVKNSAIFKKVIMKLSGNVRWMAGLVFERDVDEGGRSFKFIPHYQVTLKNPDYAKAAKGQSYDAFRGFRSHHIHLSIAVIAPLNRDWSVTNLKPSLDNYNTVHLSPRFFTHFFSWWSLFSGIMSLPVRQGKLFPGIEKTSKKFGRHLATIKYNLLLSPLFIAHMYKHKDAEDYSEDVVSATGLKIRLNSFMLDLHQRREEFATQHVKGRVKQIRTSGMKINQAQLDFISADIRAISASITGTTQEDLKRATNEELASFQETETSVDMSRFTIPDNDFSWIDMDDFVELDWILPSESNPETKIFPLAYAPRFTYFRQTDHQDSISGDRDRSSPFGNEPTHFCIMSQDNDPRRVQCELLKERIAKVDEQMEVYNRTLDEQALRVVRDDYQDGSVKDSYELLAQQGKVLESKKAFLLSMLSRLSQNIDRKQSAPESGLDKGREHETTAPGNSTTDPEVGGTEAQHLTDFVSDFNNRFIIHNIQLKWNNSLRNIILRYVHQVSQRRGFIYYMSRRAVKFILDIVQEQQKAKQRRPGHPEPKPCSSHSSPSTSPTDDCKEAMNVEDRIQELLDDTNKFVTADDPTTAQSIEQLRSYNLGSNISEEYTPQNSYHVRLIAPQIQLQSEKNAKSVLIVTAKGMQLKVISIMDKDRITDDVSGLVQRRIFVDMDSIQFFVTTQKSLTQFVHLYSGTRYGTPKGSAWPPWVPIEVNYDFKLNPFGFSRVVQKTSASLRYEKYNTLRLKYNDEVTTGDSEHSPATKAPESRMDHLWIEFPHIRATCDSSQYYTLYLIVLDLLLYSEPLEKVRSERLEKIMLASDFSDLTGAPEMVVSLQERIRQLEELRQYFQMHAKYLDRQGWQDRLSLQRDLTSCEDELFFMMKAITTSQRKNDERSQASQTNAVLRWNLSASEIVWHLMRERNDPLVEVQLAQAVYDRTDNSDGSNANSLEIGRIYGRNQLSDALYPEMLAPYFEHNNSPNDHQDIKMLKVTWYMLEAIAGIPVLDQFEVNLFPLKVQLEREVGKKLFDYIFPGAGSETGGKSPFMTRHMQSLDDEDDSETEGQQMDYSPHSNGSDDRAMGDREQSGNLNGSLEMRLRPTMGFPEHKPINIRPLGSQGTSSTHRFKFFQHSNGSQSSTKPTISRAPSKIPSVESLRNTGQAQKFALHRSTSRDSGMDKEKPSDDLTQMMARASSYMTLSYVRIPSVVLCLSYKGRGERNIEDVHNFVFRMPILEYRNKTWSNLDLALRLKKDVIRALISHTGAIIGNKFTHHRPHKHQQAFAKSSLRLPNTYSVTNATPSEASSVLDESPTFRQSAVSFRGNYSLSRTGSHASSIISPYAISPHTPEPPSIPESETEGDDTTHDFMRNTFTRRFTTDTQKTSHKETNGGDHHTLEDSPRKKGVLTFGKKILDSLS